MNYTAEELKSEKWKPIFGYDGMYEVSDLGRVRSHKSGEWKVMSPNKNRFGYLLAYLSKDGKPKNTSVHRLVAQTFIPNDDESKNEINHIDENKENNRVSNLEWCDRRYNNTYNDIHLRRKKHKKHNCPKQFNCKRRKLEQLYRSDLTIKENIKLFKEQGIECSRQTVYAIRNDLGLVPLENPKYKTLKDLYNPNLTYNENIAIFKSKGIECSVYELWRLRKDLGLAKRYKVS